jgi:hypothetical protein
MVIADPPSELGAVKAMFAVVLPGVAVPIVGAPGTVRGVTDADADAALVPIAFVAVTVQAYALPLVRPETEIGLAVPGAVTAADAPVWQEAVYPVIAEPPFEVGAVKATDADPLPGVAVPMVGAAGAPTGVTETVDEAALDPTALVALTEQLYCEPFVSPVTLIGLADPEAVTAALVPVMQETV